MAGKARPRSRAGETLRVDAGRVGGLHRGMKKAREHGVSRVRRRGGSGRGEDVRHVQGNYLSQAVEVAVVCRGIQASRRDDVERVQGSDEGPMSKDVQVEGSIELATA